MAAAGIAAAGIIAPDHGMFREGPSLLRTSTGAVAMPAEDGIRELMMTALSAAKAAGASYSDVRIGRYRNSVVATRERQITRTADTDSIGAGVRVLVDGTWGFAATNLLTTDSVAAAAREAVVIAKANRVARDMPVELAPTEVYKDATWKSAFTTDPFTIPLEQRADLLLRANAAAMGVKGLSFVTSALAFVKEERNFASSEGSVITQTVVRSSVPFQATSGSSDGLTSNPSVRNMPSCATHASPSWNAVTVRLAGRLPVPRASPVR